MHVYGDGHTHPVSAIASQDTTLLSASDKTLVVTDMVAGKIKQRLSGGHTGRINSVDIRSEALYLSASYDGTLKIWDARNLNRHTPIQSCNEAKDSVTAVKLDGPHSFYTTSVDGYIRLYDSRQGQITCCDVGAPIVSMAVATDCIAVSCLDGMIRLIEKDLGQLLNTYHGSHKTFQYAVACAVTSDLLVTGTESNEGCAALYDLVSAKVKQVLQTATSHGPTCAIAAQDDCIVTASYNGKTVVWATDKARITCDS